MPSTPTKASAFASHLHKYAYTPSPPPQKGAVKQRTPVTPADDDLAPATPSKRRRVEAVKKKKDGDGLNDSPLTSSLKPTPTSKAKGQTSPSPSPAKKVVRRYAAPDVYAHLNVVTDHLEEDLRVLFCGINPGVTSSKTGHHFAHPTNKFYHALYAGGFTSRLYSPHEDIHLPSHHHLGLTNLVDRPTAEAAELSRVELRLGVPNLLDKISKTRPRLVCFVGKGIWDQFEMVVKRATISRRRQEEDGKGKAPDQAGNVKLESIGLKSRLVKMEDDDDELQNEVSVDVELCLDQEQPEKDSPSKSDVDDAGTPRRPRSARLRAAQEAAGRQAESSEASSHTPSPSPVKSPHEKPSPTFSRTKAKAPSLPSSPKKVDIKSELSTPTQTAKTKSSKPAFEWDRPRDVKMTHVVDAGQGGTTTTTTTTTLFWVVPSTSGLERTPRHKLFSHFAQLHRWLELIESDQVDLDMFDEIDLGLVDQVAASIRAKQEVVGSAQ